MLGVIRHQFWPEGRFDVTAFGVIKSSAKHKIAKLIIEASKDIPFTASEIYHVILGIPREHVKDVYQFATLHLSPEQLAPTKEQVDTFFQ